MPETQIGFARQLLGRGWRYWLRIVLVCLLGLYINEWLSENTPGPINEVRLSLYRMISGLTPHPQTSESLLLVLITDEEFWKGELEGRRPLKRDYLARLISRLCTVNAKVVGLDILLRSPVTDGSRKDQPGYRDETNELINAIRDAPKSCKIVLPRTMTCPSRERLCVPDSSVLDGNHFDEDRVRWGYINLPYDPLQLPLKSASVDGGQLESFAQAVARADDEEAANNLPNGEGLPYGGFLSPDTFVQGSNKFRANDVLTLNDDELRRSFQHRTILIGGAWSSDAYDLGSTIDGHSSPVGYVAGVYLHASYVSAILSGNVNSSPQSSLNTAIDILVVALMACVFALRVSIYRRLLYILGLGIGLGVAAYICWQNLGIFLDFTIPVFILFLHWLLDEHLLVREELSECETALRKHQKTTDVS